MEKILADNVRSLMDASADLKTQAKVAAATRGAIDQRTVGRILNAEHKVQIDTLAALAEAFDLEPYQLLVPGLNAKNPQVLRSLSAEERAFYKALEAAMDADKRGTN